MAKWTKEDFVGKLQWEGGIADMYTYAGRDVTIVDDTEFNAVWHTFCNSLEWLEKRIEEYEELLEEDMYDDANDDYYDDGDEDGA